MRTLIALILVLPAFAAAAPVHDLVEIDLSTSAARESFRTVVGDLDVLMVKPGSHAHLAVTPADRALLAKAGIDLRLLRSNMESASPYADKGPGFGIYHTWSESVAFVDSLRLLYPHVVSEKWSLGQTHEGRDIWCFRISDNPDLDENEPEVLIDGMHHAREIMGGEFTIMFAEHLATGYGVDPEITWLVDNRELYLVPIVNPDGLVYNETLEPDGGGMWRKNRRDNGDGFFGVDLNRNYPYQWGYDDIGSSPLTWSDNYRGPEASSEPEVQALKGLINSRQIRTHDSIHSYGNLLLYPWSYDDVYTSVHATFVHMAGIMTQQNGYAPSRGFELYPTNGNTIDWSWGAWGVHDQIYAFSTEIGYPAEGFWPTEERRGELFLENLWPHLYLMRAAGSFVAAHSPVTTPAPLKDIDPGMAGNLTFTVENQSPLEASLALGITVRTDDPWLQLGAATRTIAALAPLGTDDLTGDPIPISVDPACPDGHLARIIVAVHMAEGTLDYPMSLLIGPDLPLVTEDFESGAAAWTLAGGWDLTSADSHSPVQSLTDSPGGAYADAQTATATLDGQYRATELSFWHRFQIEEGYDFGQVQVSADGGPWGTLGSFTGSQALWTEQRYPLDQYLGQQLAFRFALVSDVSVVDDGWYVDDVEIRGVSSGLNLPPTVPVAVAPMGGAVLTAVPALTVAPSSDPEGATVVYGFRVYSDELCTLLVDGTDDDAPSWTPAGLPLGNYWWRAWAGDGQERSDLCAAESFSLISPSNAGFAVTGPWLKVLDSVSDGGTRLELGLPTGGAATVDIHDARGMRVRRLVINDQGPGTRTVLWDGRDSAGRAAASGVYLVRVVAREQVLRGRVVVVR